MDFEALKRLEKTKDTIKKIDKYLQNLSVDSNEYYKALCYKATVLHSLKNDEEALKILLPLEKKLWALKNDEVIELADVLMDIYFDLNDPDKALKYIKIKEEHLLLIDHDKYTKDLIRYYRFIGDTLNEKRQILIYLEENINENDLIDIYERLIEFAYNEDNKADFDKYYDKVKEYYLKHQDKEKIIKIDYYKCHFLFEDNIIDAYSFASKKLSEDITDNEKVAYAIVCIKYFMAQEELRKASIVDSNFSEIAYNADIKFKREYLITTLELYKRLNNRFSIDVIENELSELKDVEPVKEKKTVNNRQVQKKLDIINQFVEEKEPSESSLNETPKEVKPAQEEKKEIKPRIDVTLNTYASGYYRILNETIKYLNEISKTQREPIRKALIEMNKQVKFSEAHIIYKMQEGLLGYQFKDGRLYDKSFKDENLIESSFIYQSYLKQIDVYSNDSDFDIITLKESLFDLKIVFPFLGPQPLGAIAFYFKAELQNIDYEILKAFAYILEEYIKRNIYKEQYELDEKIKSFYIDKQELGFIKVLDNVLYFNETAARIFDININILKLDEFYELIGSSSKSQMKSLFESLANGKDKQATLSYYLNDRRMIESQFNVYELKKSFIAVFSVLDITEREKNKDSLIKASLSDSLVNIKSMKALQNELPTLYQEKKFSIMLMDAKDFKRYNDVYGLKFHNDLIKAIGVKLLKLSTSYKASIYHYDSDKFFVIIPNNDERNTIKLFNKLLDALTEELFLLNNRVKLYFNGVILRILLKSPKYSLDKIIDMLSNTLLGLKDNNDEANSLAYYDSSVADKAFYDFQMELHLSEAIDKGLIQVSYNQIGSFKNKGIFAYRARIQLINTLVSENYFDSIIQKRGLSDQIDRYIVSHALMELNSFKEEIGGVYNLVIPLYNSKLNQSFIDFYYDKLRFFKINPKNIYFIVNEIEENLDLKYVNLISKSIDMAIKYHAKFYTTNYNNFSILDLKQLNDFLKLLNVDVILDGVEKKDTLEILIKNDFNYISGRILKGNYLITDLISLNKNDKVL